MNEQENIRPRAWIFGGTSDMGQDIITALCDSGFDVNFTWNRNEEHASAILKKHPDAKQYKLDLGSKTAVTNFCTRYGDLLSGKLIVYCAGVNNATLCDDLPAEKLDVITRINFISAAEIFNVIARRSKPDKSNATKFIYISSVAAKKITPGNTLYGATKIAMERYLSGMAAELSRFNIRTLCIRPGYVKTRMLDNYCSDKGIELRDLLKRIPCRKLLTVNDITNVVIAFHTGNIVTTGTVITLGNGEEFIS